MSDTQRLTVKLPTETWEGLTALSQSRGQTKSGFIRLLVRAELERAGMEPGRQVVWGGDRTSNKEA